MISRALQQMSPKKPTFFFFLNGYARSVSYNGLQQKQCIRADNFNKRWEKINFFFSKATKSWSLKTIKNKKKSNLENMAKKTIAFSS